MFEDRTEAGEQLADELLARGVSADVVLGIPRGAMPVARPVADRLDATLSVVIASKMGAPGNEELAIGAVAEDGARWLNDGLVRQSSISKEYIVERTHEAREAAQEKATAYRDGPLPDLEGERVVLVDDGVATGATMRACLGLVREQGPAELVVGVPVGPADTLRALEEGADELVALRRPKAFRSVGAYYRNFDQVTDEEAKGYLE